MPWVVIGLSVGLIAVGAGLAAVLIARRRDPDPAPLGSEMTGEQWFTLGVVFTGAGVALMASLGPAMIGILALGIISMSMGARMKHQEGRNEDKETE